MHQSDMSVRAVPAQGVFRRGRKRNEFGDVRATLRTKVTRLRLAGSGIRFTSDVRVDGSDRKPSPATFSNPTEVASKFAAPNPSGMWPAFPRGPTHPTACAVWPLE